MKATDLSLLAAPFDESDVEWRVGSVTRDKSKGMALAYLTNRAVQSRLDSVCTPADWKNEYKPGPEGGVICGLSIRVERDGEPPEWVTKWDGADSTDVEAVKGGLSDAMKRAAVQWGIGRDLYALPQQWVRLDERGRFAEPPRFSSAGASPSRSSAGSTQQRPARPARAQAPPRRDPRVTRQPEAPATPPRYIKALALSSAPLVRQAARCVVGPFEGKLDAKRAEQVESVLMAFAEGITGADYEPSASHDFFAWLERHERTIPTRDAAVEAWRDFTS